IARGQLPFDKACYICHSASENPSDQFKRFYQWISQKYKPDNRRVAIVAGMIKGEAADWYNLIYGDIDR
ncbi:18438_t:CDS:2, partial [Funneliformis geosporum]